MSTMIESPRFVRRVSWVAALIFVAGVVAFATAYFGRSDDSTAVAEGPAPAAVQQQTTPQKTVPVDPKARVVAGQFILWAVAGENLAKSWDITHPTLKQGYTREEWVKGDIPVVPYPGAAIDKASFAIDESYEDHVVLQVALLPKDKADVKSQIFYIGLQKENGRWLVDYWMPKAINPVPVQE